MVMADEDFDTQLMVRREATIMLLKKGKPHSSLLMLYQVQHRLHHSLLVILEFTKPIVTIHAKYTAYFVC
tara:strand:- start:32 stop:241 length:210 start_codon:yes stop_codon:yes gene_type:complete